jgi:hypothetical protein
MPNAQIIWESNFGVLQDSRHALEHPASADRDRQALLPQHTAHDVDASRARRLLLRTDAMERLQRLLLDGLHRHGPDAATPIGFEQGFGVRAVGLVSTYVGPDILHGRQTHAEITRLAPSSPIVRRPAPLHHDLDARCQSIDEALELAACQPLSLENPPPRLASATSKMSFARSTATVVASISVSSWLRGVTHSSRQ